MPDRPPTRLSDGSFNPDPAAWAYDLIDPGGTPTALGDIDPRYGVLDDDEDPDDWVAQPSR